MHTEDQLNDFIEIINLEAIQQLPKATEHFVSDLHGEYEAFDHILRNGSGSIREKVETLFQYSLTAAEKTELCFLIYYPKEVLQEKDYPHDSTGQSGSFYFQQIYAVQSSKSFTKTICLYFRRIAVSI